jgi:hypothetical protein
MLAQSVLLHPALQEHHLLLLERMLASMTAEKLMLVASDAAADKQLGPVGSERSTAAEYRVLLLLSQLEQQLKAALQQPGRCSLQELAQAMPQVSAGWGNMLGTAVPLLPVAHIKPLIKYAMQQVQEWREQQRRQPNRQQSQAKTLGLQHLQHPAVALRALQTALRGYQLAMLLRTGSADNAGGASSSAAAAGTTTIATRGSSSSSSSSAAQRRCSCRLQCGCCSQRICLWSTCTGPTCLVAASAQTAAGAPMAPCCTCCAMQ